MSVCNDKILQFTHGCSRSQALFTARFPLLVKDVKMDGDAFDPYTVEMLRMTTSRLMSGRKSLAHDVIN